jgi:hypothetical protein
MTTSGRMVLGSMAVSALILFSASAHSASLERLGDGRVVITVFGERLAFRESDVDNVYFWWSGTYGDTLLGLAVTRY